MCEAPLLNKHSQARPGQAQGNKAAGCPSGLPRATCACVSCVAIHRDTVMPCLCPPSPSAPWTPHMEGVPSLRPWLGQGQGPCVRTAASTPQGLGGWVGGGLLGHLFLLFQEDGDVLRRRSLGGLACYWGKARGWGGGVHNGTEHRTMLRINIMCAGPSQGGGGGLHGVVPRSSGGRSRHQSGRDVVEGKGPPRRPQKRLGRRLEEVAEAVGGGYCRLQMPLKLALGVRETVAGHRLGALEGGASHAPPTPCALAVLGRLLSKGAKGNRVLWAGLQTSSTALGTGVRTIGVVPSPSFYTRDLHLPQQLFISRHGGHVRGCLRARPAPTGGGGGVGTRPRYPIGCLWRRLLASRNCSF